MRFCSTLSRQFNPLKRHVIGQNRVLVRFSSNDVLANPEYSDPQGSKYSMSKIVGTVGPVSHDYSVLQALTDEGLRIMRINFSHATYKEAEQSMVNLRACRGVHSRPSTLDDKSQRPFNLRAILLDTQGPEIRTGVNLAGKNSKIPLVTNETLVLTGDAAFAEAGNEKTQYVTYPKLSQLLNPNDIVLLDDGAIRLQVLATEQANQSVTCRILNDGLLGSRKGVNLPGIKTDLPALTSKDKENIEFGIKNDIDFLAASFIRKAEDVVQIRKFIKEKMGIYFDDKDHPAPLIISKIENLEGIENFSEILKESDGIMVARGDLGVEIPIKKVFKYQKQMVEECNKVGKPVIVATQMLENMIKNPQPTRAEVSDIGNAVLDGADCVMLSGEVAQGKYPVEAVKMMLSVIKEADTLLADRSNSSSLFASLNRTQFIHKNKQDSPNQRFRKDVEIVAENAVKTAHDSHAKLIIVLTDTGYAARMVAKNRPQIPVMCLATNPKIGRQLQLYRGLFPIMCEDSNVRPTYGDAVEKAKDLGWISHGDTVVLISAEPMERNLGRQVLLRVAEIE